LGVTDSTRNRIVFGAGTLKVDGVDVGATTDKTILRIVQEIYEPHFDGVLGPLEQSLHRTRLVASLEFIVVEIRADLLSYAMTRAVPIGLLLALTYTNPIIKLCMGDGHSVIWTGEDCDGDPITVSLENAVQLKEFEVSFTDTEEAKFGLKFLTTYDSADYEHIPFNIVVGTT